MKAVVLAAGYGTRLQRDVDTDSSGRYRHLAGTAKPLLPVGRCALISHWVRSLTAAGCVDCVYVVTNALYHKAFEEWAAEFSNVKILSDQTRSNDETRLDPGSGPILTSVCPAEVKVSLEINRIIIIRPQPHEYVGLPDTDLNQKFKERLGAVACLHLAVKHFKIEDHIIVIGGDTLFREDFSLNTVNNKFSDLQATCEDSCLVLSYQCKDEETPKYGILEVGEDLRVLCMKEKPLPTETNSRRACPCFYVLSKKSLLLLDAFLDEKRESPIEEKDAPGNFVSWLIPRKPVYTHQIAGRFDVGNLPSYVECDLYFREKLQDVESYMV